ncbi:hypothetical protein NC653_018857 [Populus alba x Populus x berolinensis]|uniref:Uncharacterized protein n=1 Tax=Populus alba x Populus x berolinensis TaxID=444605 RepID=A0AAD6VWE1_9ROSI|nr:hypothetical protein NC653_018857 [Populus alba x Populus x berolinensis]
MGHKYLANGDTKLDLKDLCRIYRLEKVKAISVKGRKEILKMVAPHVRTHHLKFFKAAPLIVREMS